MGVSASGVDALRARAQQDVDEGVLPACQYALALSGEVIVSETLGAARPDARFSIWSATKPVFASVVWQLIGEDALDPAAPVTDLWPEFGRKGKGAITLEHLLLFTAGIPEPAVDLEAWSSRDTRVAQMEGWDLAWTPGTQCVYHPFSAHWVMAELVARVTGQDHCEALRQRVLGPLGLDRLELGVPQGRAADVQALVETGEPSTLEEVAQALGLPELPPALVEMMESAVAGAGAVPQVGLRALQEPAMLALGIPGGGAVSDAASLALFYQALLHDPKGVWAPGVRRDVTRNVRNTFLVPPLGVVANRTLGLEVQGDDATARHRSGSAAASPATFGHGGAAGQIAWADPVSGLSFAYLTNGSDRNVIRQTRRVRELAAAAVACLD